MQIILLELPNHPVKMMYSVTSEKTLAKKLNHLLTDSEPGRGRAQILTPAF